MLPLHPQFLTSSTGERLSVVISIAEFDTIIEELEMIEDVRLYDEVMAADEPAIPANEVYARIEAQRNKVQP